MRTNIWIMNHYAGDMYFNKGGRHYWFAKYLRREGYKPVVFCCNAKHNASGYFINTDKLWVEQIAEEISTPWIFVQARAYTSNGKDRVLNMIDFYRNVKRAAKEYAALYGKPDVIFASSVHPLTLVAGIQLSKHFGVKCICEVPDLWAESIVVYSHRIKKSNPLIRILYRGERWIYKKADALIFTMEGAYDYIKEQGWEKDIPRSKVHYINNGVDLEAFQYNRDHFQIYDQDLQNPDIFKIVYTGSIRLVNNLGLLLDAAKQVTDPRVRFLIWGDGDERAKLEQRVQDENITNVVFKGRVGKKYIPYITNQANANLMHGGDLAKALHRFGTSPNKLFDYFASGKPILMDQVPKYNPVEQFHAGICVDGTANLPYAVEQCLALPPEELSHMKENAYKAAHRFDFRNLTQDLIDIIEKES